MAELLIRASGQDAPLLRKMYGVDGTPRAAGVPNRIVVDAHTASRSGEYSTVARRAGVPFLIDPQTFFLQDLQHASHAWGKLPYGDHGIATPSDIENPTRREQFVRNCITYQIEHGATAVLAPYVYMDNLDSPWLDVQSLLWRETRRHLDENAISLPVIAILAIGWRLLHPVQGPKALARVMSAIDTLMPDEVALTASKVTEGAKPHSRLTDLLVMIERIKRNYPVIAWQQGLFGEVCLAAGASGYETGIGWREKCDLPTAMGAHRRAPSTSGFGRRPVYVTSLGRSIPAATFEALRSERTLWPKLICSDSSCCPPNGVAMSGDARAHAVVARTHRMSHLTSIARPIWQWRELESRAETALLLANRINRLGESVGFGRVDVSTMTAIHKVAHQRRLDGRSRHAA